MKKRKLAAITILAAALCLSGCGGSSSSNGAYHKEQAAGSSYEESYAREDAMMAAEAESADAAAGDYAGDYTADGGETDSALRAQDGQKIVYTGNLRIQTLEYDKSAASIRQKIKEAGGFSESESERDNNYYWYSYNGGNGSTRYLDITARIPSEKFESFINSLSGDGKIMSRSVNAENISQVYANKETYKKSLEIAEVTGKQHCHVMEAIMRELHHVRDMAIDADDFRLRGRLSLAMQHRHHGVRIADGVTVLIGARNALLLSEILNVRSFDMAQRRAE